MRAFPTDGSYDGQTMETIVELILDESKWLPLALAASIGTVSVRLAKRRRGGVSRTAIGNVMHIAYGCMLGVMGTGHLLAVTVRSLGAEPLQSSLWILYPIGAVLAVPGWWLVKHAWRTEPSKLVEGKTAPALNVFLAGSLVGLGPHNLPLAFPALLNLGYRFLSRPILRWTVVALAVIVYSGLLAGSLVFMASGGSFEEFSGMEQPASESRPY